MAKLSQRRTHAATLVQLLGMARRWADSQGILTETEYRRRLGRMFNGRTSASSLTAAEQQQVLTGLFERELGWQRTGKGGAPAPGTGRRQLERSPASTKIRALWLFLHVLGEVHDSSERALAHYVKRQVGVEDLHWLTAQQKSDVIEALKFWAVRPMRADVERMLAELAPGSAAHAMATKAATSKSWAPWWRAWLAACAAAGRRVDEAISKPLAVAPVARKEIP